MGNGTVGGNEIQVYTKREPALEPHHAGPISVDATPKVQSTTSTKFRSSRIMKRFVCAVVKFSIASRSDLKRVR